MISGVLRLGDRAARGVMTPRNEVDWLDVTAGTEAVHAALMRTAHSRLPVAEGSPDQMIGAVQSRELLAAMLCGEPMDIRALMRAAPMVPDTADALDLLATPRAAEVPMALVLDEHGHFEGIVTPTDLTGAIVGEFRSDVEAGDEPAAVRREDGSWLLSGWMPADEMAERLRLNLSGERGYETVAGFVLQAMKRLPQVGEAVEAHGWHFEVVDLDGRRIDKVLAAKAEPEDALFHRRPGAGQDAVIGQPPEA
jgi:putative hemolysin